MPLELDDVKKAVQVLENDPDLADLHTDAEARYLLYELLDEPHVSEALSRGEVVEANTPILGWLTDSVTADMAAFPTYVTVTPYNKEDQKIADKIEKFAQLWYLRINDGMVPQEEGRWHQFNTGWFCWQLQVTDDEMFPWELLSPDPLTCYFPIKGSPQRPRRFARKYKMLVGEVRNTYTNKRGSQPGFRPKYENGGWDWEELSDDYDSDGDVSHGASTTDDYKEVTMLYFADGRNCYHVVLNDDGKGGKLMWVGEDMTGGVPAVVIPGLVTPLRKASERLRPAFYPAYQMAKLINRVRAKRETRSDQATEDLIVQQDAEQIKAEATAKASGINTDEIALERGKPSIIKTPGTVAFWERQKDEDLDKLEQSYWAELDRYLNTWLENTSPDVLADSKANVYLTYAENRRKKLGKVLKHMDWGWMTVIKMALHSVTKMDQPFTLFADDDVTYGTNRKIAKTEGVTITPADVKDFDKRFRLTVTTRSITDAERRAAVEDWAYQRTLGIATLREGITASGEMDETEKIKTLLEEAALEVLAPQILEQMAIVAEERIRLESDIIVTLARTRRQEAAPATGGGGMNRMSAPALEPVSGGSDGMVTV